MGDGSRCLRFRNRRDSICTSAGAHVPIKAGWSAQQTDDGNPDPRWFVHSGQHHIETWNRLDEYVTIIYLFSIVSVADIVVCGGWIGFLIAAFLQGCLLIMCTVWKARQRKLGIDDFGNPVFLPLSRSETYLAGRGEDEGGPVPI